MVSNVGMYIIHVWNFDYSAIGGFGGREFRKKDEERIIQKSKEERNEEMKK